MRLRRPSAIVALVIVTTAVLISMSGCATHHLLVLSQQTNEILRYNGNTGAFIDVFVPSASIHSALASLVFGPDRNLYVTSFVAEPSNTRVGKVLRYDGTTGALIDVFVAPGSGGLIRPTGLTFGPDCSLYVAGGTSKTEGGQVLRYQGGTGGFVDTFVPMGSGGLLNARSLAFGPDGNLYVADPASERVLRYDGATGAFLGIFVPAGSGGPIATGDLLFGPDGNLYVTHSSTVVRYNGNSGAYIDTFALGGDAGVNLALAFGPDGDLYVTRYIVSDVVMSLDAVYRYNGTTGAFIGAFVPPGSGGLWVALSLAFIPRPVIKQIDTLLVAVEKLRLPSDTETSLSAALRTARTAVDTGRILLARNQLDAFTEKVRPNLGNLIPQPQGNRLISAADALRAQLRCL